ncbi:MAG: YjbQ family protein [Nitrospira sp.]|nr:YjbQ family protein [Nitrospira sp.]
MRVHMQGDCQVENITRQVQEAVGQTQLRTGILTLFIKHTTASVLIIEDEPGIRADTKALWQRLIPADPDWQHNTRNQGEDNGHSHLRGQLQGHSLTIPFNDGVMTLGTWQQIVVLDFDTRARTRELVLQVMGE